MAATVAPAAGSRGRCMHDQERQDEMGRKRTCMGRRKRNLLADAGGREREVKDEDAKLDRS